MKIIDLRGDSRIMAPQGGLSLRPVSGVVDLARHHTAGNPNSTIFDVQTWWRNGLGWRTGGYHEFILRNGDVQLVYHDNVITNGVLNHNRTTYHIALAGNSDFTPEQERSFDERAMAFMERRNRPVSSVRGHNEFTGHRSNTCPGNNIDMNLVRRRIAQLLEGLEAHDMAIMTEIRKIQGLENTTEAQVAEALAEVLRHPMPTGEALNEFNQAIEAGISSGVNPSRAIPRWQSIVLAFRAFQRRNDG